MPLGFDPQWAFDDNTSTPVSVIGLTDSSPFWPAGGNYWFWFLVVDDNYANGGGPFSPPTAQQFVSGTPFELTVELVGQFPGEDVWAAHGPRLANADFIRWASDPGGGYNSLGYGFVIGCATGSTYTKVLDEAGDGDTPTDDTYGPVGDTGDGVVMVFASDADNATPTTITNFDSGDYNESGDALGNSVAMRAWGAAIGGALIEVDFVSASASGESWVLAGWTSPAPPQWSVGSIRWGNVAVCVLAATSEETVAPGGDVGEVSILFDVITGLPVWATAVGDTFELDGNALDGFNLIIQVTGLATSTGATDITVTIEDPGLFATQSQSTGTPGTDVPFDVTFNFSGFFPATTYTVTIELSDLTAAGATLDPGVTLEMCLEEPA